MKKKILMWAFLSVCQALMPAGAMLMAQTTLNLQLTSREAHTAAPIVMDLAPYGTVRSALVKVEGEEVPVQLDDLDGDNQYDELCFLVDMKRHDKKTAQVTLSPEASSRSYEPKTFAEIVLRNPKVKEKNKHDIYLSSISIDQATKNPYNVLHHHGVAFENEWIAMRIYMDPRQTIDLYGKNHQGLEIEQTQFYPSKEQKAQGFGDDVLWVGNTFGLGAFRGWDGEQPTLLKPVRTRTQRILCQGPVRTIVEVEDQGWALSPGSQPVNLRLRYTLYARHRDFDVDASFVGDVSSHKFSTGLINVKNSEEYSDHHGLRGCWGTDWPASDTVNWKRETVGLGIYIPDGNRAEEQKATKDNYAFVLEGQPEYHYSLAYTSANEDFGYHNAADWFAFLRQWKKEKDDKVKLKIIHNS